MIGRPKAQLWTPTSTSHLHQQLPLNGPQTPMSSVKVSHLRKDHWDLGLSRGLRLDTKSTAHKRKTCETGPGQNENGFLCERPWHRDEETSCRRKSLHLKYAKNSHNSAVTNPMRKRAEVHEDMQVFRENRPACAVLPLAVPFREDLRYVPYPSL